MGPLAIAGKENHMTGQGSSAAGLAARELLIDRQLPQFQARTFSAVLVEAGAERTYQAVRALDPDQVGQSVPFMQLMVRLRDLPARLGRRAPGAVLADPERLASEQYRQAFLLIDEEPGTEFVIGMIGKFTSPREMEFRRFDPPQFAAFGEPGYGKVATGFLVLPYGTGRSLLCTETRTVTTDPDSARRFRRYWKVIGPFAGYIMRHWLTLAKQHAEQDPAAANRAEERPADQESP
jgi:hypothetical protein